MNGWIIAGLVVLVIVAWLGFWVALISLIARLGGWRRLALIHPLQERDESSEARHPLAIDSTRDTQKNRRSFAMQSMVIGRFTNYNHVVHFTVREDGLALSVMNILSFGHAPMLLPWREMKATPATRLGFKMVKLEMARAPRATITITDALARKLASAAGDDWPTA